MRNDLGVSFIRMSCFCIVCRDEGSTSAGGRVRTHRPGREPQSGRVWAAAPFMRASAWCLQVSSQDPPDPNTPYTLEFARAQEKQIRVRYNMKQLTDRMRDQRLQVSGCAVLYTV